MLRSKIAVLFLVLHLVGCNTIATCFPQQIKYLSVDNVLNVSSFIAQTNLLVKIAQSITVFYL